MEISSQEKQHLLSIAHYSIQSTFNSEIEEPKADQDSLLFQSKSGAFVTLTIHKKLRGCIGYIESEQPLHETIIDAAYQAAFHDPRFAPITEDE